MFVLFSTPVRRESYEHLAPGVNVRTFLDALITKVLRRGVDSWKVNVVRRESYEHLVPGVNVRTFLDALKKPCLNVYWECFIWLTYELQLLPSTRSQRGSGDVGTEG